MQLFKLTNIFVLLLLLPPQTYAQPFKNKSIADDFNLQQHETFAPSDKNRISLFGGVHPTLTSDDRLLLLGAAYSRRYSTFWLDTTVAQSYGSFRRFSANNPTATGATSMGQIASEKNTLLTFGLGIAHEGQYTSELLSLPNFFEFIAVDLTYNIYKEKYSGKSFIGPGMLAKFSAYRKFADVASLGFHFNYALAMVKRSQDNDDEDSSERSLTLGTFTVGVDMSFYL